MGELKISWSASLPSVALWFHIGKRIYMGMAVTAFKSDSQGRAAFKKKQQLLGLGRLCMPRYILSIILNYAYRFSFTI